MVNLVASSADDSSKHKDALGARHERNLTIRVHGSETIGDTQAAPGQGKPHLCMQRENERESPQIIGQHTIKSIFLSNNEN